MRRWWTGLSIAASLGCVTAVERGPAGVDETQLLQSRAVQGWTIHSVDQLRGSVIRLEPWSDPTRFYYVVRNVHGQDLGTIDALGRAFRFRPHQTEPEWVGSGTVAQGAERILGLESVEIRETSLAALEALAGPNDAGTPTPAHHRK